MARRGKDDGDEQVIEFTPEAGFTIEKLARELVRHMRELEMDARVILPNMVLEIEKDCTPKEIVDGYNEAMKAHITIRHPSNKNEK